MKSFSWNLALRYLNPLRTFVSVITLISLLGVAMGVAVLIVVLSVHNGFERTLKDNLLGFSPHVTVSPRVGLIEDYEAEQKRLIKEDEVVSVSPLLEGFAIVDSRRYQKPVRFRAINSMDEKEVASLEGMLDEEYPITPNSELKNKADIGLEQNAVVSRQLAKSLQLDVGDELRLVAASNLDAIIEVYNVPEERAWELYTETFTEFEAAIEPMFEVGEEEELADLDKVGQVSLLLDGLLPTPDQDGLEMRPAERRMIVSILDQLSQGVQTKQDASKLSFFSGTKEAILATLKELRELDTEKADNQAFREIDEFVLPKTLIVWGVYHDTKRSQGPELFIPLELGMELKDLEGYVETMGLRLEDPYRAELVAQNIGESLGPDWTVRSWMVTYSEQFALLKTEKMMMSFALSFITLLSAFSITAVMYTVTIQKRQEIGVMKALGARPSQIIRVFLYQGLIVGIVGAAVGYGLGELAVYNREHILSSLRIFGFDPFPANFHDMTEMPAHIDYSQVSIILVMAVVLCLLAALIPALMAAFRDPAKSLRNL